MSGRQSKLIKMSGWRTPSSGTVAYRRNGPPIRDVYEEQFRHDPRDVQHHRVVNIVQKRNSFPRPGHDYDGVYDDDPWYGAPRHYQDMRDYHEEDQYQHNDRRYFDGNSSFGNYPRNSPPQRNEAPYSQQSYARDDLRHQLSARKSSRSHYFRGRGRGSGQKPAHSRKVKEDRDYRTTTSLMVKRDRSPVQKEGPTPATARSGSNTSSKNVSEETEKGQTSEETQQKNKPSVVVSQTTSSSVEDSPCSSGSLKEQPSASVAESEKKKEEEKEEEGEVVEEKKEEVTASMEPKLTPEEDFKARRSEAIKTKAAEIEKHFRQDCETFRTVVMMLVAKDPRLENLLQASLDENLLEIKQHCLDALRSFVTELDQLAEQADASA